MDQQAIKRWHCQTHHGRRGRGFHYSDTTIETALILKGLFKLPLRALEAFINSLPTMLCQDELASGELVTLLPEWQQPRMPIYLLFPERQLMPRKLRAFIDFMVENGAEFGIDKLL